MILNGKVRGEQWMDGWMDGVRTTMTNKTQKKM